RGATFVIDLPVAEGTDLPPAVLSVRSRSPFPPRPAGGSGKSVLVIDDEQWILDLASELLSAEGHQVELALGGQEALERLRVRAFDVIVSDWKMPGLNGVRLYEHLVAT